VVCQGSVSTANDAGKGESTVGVELPQRSAERARGTCGQCLITRCQFGIGLNGEIDCPVAVGLEESRELRVSRVGRVRVGVTDEVLRCSGLIAQGKLVCNQHPGIADTKFCSPVANRFGKL